jgi:hypothetical protein
MGHVRLGRLPSSRDWRKIVGYVAAGDISVAELADAVADASDKSLMKAIRDPAHPLVPVRQLGAGGGQDVRKGRIYVL